MAHLEGIVTRIVFRNEENGFTVASLQPEGETREKTIVGTLPFFQKNDCVAVDGEIVQNSRYGEQLKVSSYSLSQPKDASAVEKYLASGWIKGIGKATAHQLVEAFGEETLDVLATAPEKLHMLKGFGKKRIEMIAASFAEQNGMRTTLMFLQSYGIAPTLSARICKQFGTATEMKIRKNPYCLADEVDGVGFRTADTIAAKLGFSAESPYRIRSGILYCLTEAENGEGHCFLPEEMLAERAAHLLGAPRETIAAQLTAMGLRNDVIINDVGDVRAVYLPQVFRAEDEAALLLRRLSDGAKSPLFLRKKAEALIDAFERRNEVELHENQREAVFAATEGGVTIITGGPGTGKTTSLHCILSMLETLDGVRLCAPTGRAAKRMSEATGRDAMTIHRLLEFNGESGGFARDENNPLKTPCVIVDEVSMVDLFLLRALLRALLPGTRLVLVGDVDQLPSVGAGAVLKDLLESERFRTVRLTEIFRQAQQSMIVVNAHRINRGEMPVLRVKDTDFFFEHKENYESVGQSVVSLLKTRLPKYLGMDDEKGIQVMTPMKRGAVGVYALNERLQAALNPPAPDRPELKRGDGIFRLGDRVIQVKNDYEREWEDDEAKGTGVFNGDIGYISEVDAREGSLTVRFEDGRRAMYVLGDLDELELAYCMSVHKSQGSEFDAVVLPLLGGPQLLMARNLLYTAVTRAKRLVVIVGRLDCVKEMVDNAHVNRRYTALAGRIRGDV